MEKQDEMLEPFGDLYPLSAVKADSEANLKPRRERQARVAAWREFGMTLVSLLLAVGISGMLMSTSV